MVPWLFFSLLPMLLEVLFMLQVRRISFIFCIGVLDVLRTTFLNGSYEYDIYIKSGILLLVMIVITDFLNHF